MKRHSLSLRSRIVVVMIALVLGTALVLSYVTRGFLDQSLTIGINSEVRSVLSGALSVARASYNDRRDGLRRIGERLAASPQAGRAFDAGDLPLLRRLVEAQEGGGRVSEVRIVRFTDAPSAANVGAPLAGEALQEALRGGPYLYRDERQDDLLRMLVPVRSGDRLAGALVLDQRLDPTYESIKRAAQTYEDISLREQTLRRSYREAFFAVALGVLLLAALVGVRVAFGVTNPLRDLVRGTEELARDNLSHRIPRHRDDEIGILIASFNRMATDLQENRRQRVEAEKVAAWREIARRLAHEIKNPLTPIQLTVQQMRDKYPGDDPAYRRLLDDCADIVTDEVETLKNLVRAFADFARLPDLKAEPADLNALVSDVGKLYADAPLTLALAVALPAVMADETQMRRALINLIQNAEDALGEGGGITITTRTGHEAEEGNRQQATGNREGMRQQAAGESESPEDPMPHASRLTPHASRLTPAGGGVRWVELEVSDTGRGIPPEHLDRIFEPYFSTKRTGMGLGLAIVRNIIEQHGGQISVRSRADEGTAFTIRLPIPADHESQVTNESRITSHNLT